MTLPEYYRMEIKQGASYREWWALEFDDGTVPDLATEGNGYTYGRLVIRPAYGETKTVDLTTDNGGVVIERQQDAEGLWQSGYFYISASTAATLQEWGEAVYDFEISDGTDDVPVLTGVAVVSPTTVTEEA